jgi:hypothetical protein
MNETSFKMARGFARFTLTTKKKHVRTSQSY